MTISNGEILVLFVYAYIIIQIVLFNQKLANSLKQDNKDTLVNIIAKENRNLNFTLFSSIIGTIIFYFYFSFLSFLFFFILTSVLICSYNFLINSLNKKGTYNV